MTYNPAVKTLLQVIRKFLELLDVKLDVKKVFSPDLLVFFRSTRSIKSYLVRSQICSESVIESGFTVFPSA